MSASRLVNVYTLFAVILAVACAVFPPFRHWSNMTSLLGNASPLVMAAAAQMFAMLVWGIDLSVGSIMNVVIVSASFVLDGPSYQVALGIVGCLLIGALLGLVNGLLICRLRLPDFVVTLATFISYQGIALILRPTPGGGISPGLLTFMYGSTLGLPNSTWVLLAIVAVLGVVLRATRIGHYIVAVGSSRESSFLLGLPVDRIRIIAYVLSGTCGAVAGLFLMGLIGTGAANAATPFQLNSIIATVIGGTSLYGGKGSLIGTIFGALILQIALKMLTYANLLGSYVLVFEGAVVVLVVALVALAQRRGGRRRMSGSTQAV